MVMEWRLETPSGGWSPWSDDKAAVLAIASNPEHGTGRVQERVRPPRNEVVIEKVEA